MTNSNIENIEDINRALSENFIHYEPSRIDYSINDHELNMLEQTGNSLWKDMFIATLGLGLPSLVNGYTSFSKLPSNTPWNTEIFLNFLIAGITLILSIFSFVVWQSNKKSFQKTIQDIKSKPKFRVPSSSL